MLERAADAFEADTDRLIGLIVREAGKTYANAVGEVREAVDFLRYYAAQARGTLASDASPLGVIVASARGTSRCRSSPGRSPRRSPPAMRCSRSLRSRRR